MVGVKLVCRSKACGLYSWEYKGKRTVGQYVGCPKCKSNIKVIEVQE